MRLFRSSPIGFALALLALVAQLALGAVVPAAQAAEPIPICHADDDSSGPEIPTPAHPLGCLLCPVCPAQATTVSLLTPTPVAVPAPRVPVLGRPGGTIITTAATPPPPYPAAYPRAPPSHA
jgi:hypothetical protein